MKPIHLQTKNESPSNISFLITFVFVILNLTVTSPLRTIDYTANMTDHTALLAIKSQLLVPSNRVLGSWNESIHHCYWEGVTCGRKHKRVTVLDLSSRGLAGTISPFVGNLSFLKILYLYNNSLYGEIPSQLGHLIRLHELRLYNNSLVGEIPANISRCVNLRVFSLGYNKLEGNLPQGLRALSNLEHFSVYHNYLMGPLFDIIQNLTSLVTISATLNSFTETIPNNIGRMRNLTILEVAANELSGTIPPFIFNLSSLQYLDLIDNQLHGELPTYIGSTIPPLKWLNFEGNNFSGLIPIMIQNLTTLEYISFHGNSFIGRVSYDFGNFHSLNFLALGSNYLVGDINFIATLHNCSQLSVLDLGPNHFSGTLPKSVVNLSTTMRWLIIKDTPISGKFPQDITNLNNLEHLDMQNCKLTASLPEDLGKLHKLELLYLASNRIEGRIPSSLCNLSRLGNILLSYNLLEGSIPSCLGNCQNLMFLDLSYNELNGTLANELFEGSASFVELYLSHNQLEGSLPLEMSKQSNLGILELSNNKFSDVIPGSLGDCTELQYLLMNGNFFHGSIPVSFASLASLQVIDFSRNNLSGPIPAFFSKFPTLYYLNLSYNDFEGNVPTNSVFANASAVFVAGNSRLCGGIKQLQLPKCIENRSIKRIKLIIPIISALVGVVATAVGATGLYLACFKKKRRHLISGSMMGNVTVKVSYDMLLKATAGFSLDNLLGMGSFGSVFKGILDGHTVAVKVLNFQHHGASKSFMAECNTLRNVRHRNLVGLITACSSIDFQRNDFKALVYKFMPNGSLDTWLYVDGNLSLAQRVDVAIDVAHALIYLHHECETPIVHCDLKPSNILLDNDMISHVGDFGLARFLTQPRHPNQSSTIGIKGTIGYAAPEYGLGNEPSTEGDVYSYGILLLELMTGKRPTASMFKEGYSLHKYAQEALPDQVLQIVDPSLEEDNITEEVDDTRAIQDELQRRVECITVVISVGVSCSNHLPHERMKIVDARSRLQSARGNLLNAQTRRNLAARGSRVNFG